MAFIGNTVQTQGFTPAIDYFSGNGSTVTFTLSRPVASVAQMIVAVANVIQNPSSAYTVSGNSITFSSAPPAGTNNIWVEYTSLITTYNAISQSPSVIGDITTSGGFFAKGTFGNTYDDGTVVDYVTGNGRITVGSADGFTIYTGGTTGRTALASWTYAGVLTNTAGINFNGALGIGASPSYGTAGQVLTSAGSSSTPTWVNSLGGAAQSWQNVAGSRAIGTTYTNSSGAPIFISVWFDATQSGAGGNRAFNLLINGSVVYFTGWYAPTGNNSIGGTAVVPNGATYSVTTSGAGVTENLSGWWELR